MRSTGYLALLSCLCLCLFLCLPLLASCLMLSPLSLYDILHSLCLFSIRSNRVITLGRLPPDSLPPLNHTHSDSDSDSDSDSFLSPCRGRRRGLDALHPNRHFPLQIVLLALTRHHPQHAFDLRRCPEAHCCPADHPEAEEGACAR